MRADREPLDLFPVHGGGEGQCVLDEPIVASHGDRLADLIGRERNGGGEDGQIAHGEGIARRRIAIQADRLGRCAGVVGRKLDHTKGPQALGHGV